MAAEPSAQRAGAACKYPVNVIAGPLSGCSRDQRALRVNAGLAYAFPGVIKASAHPVVDRDDKDTPSGGAERRRRSAVHQPCILVEDTQDVVAGSIGHLEQNAVDPDFAVRL